MTFAPDPWLSDLLGKPAWHCSGACHELYPQDLPIPPAFVSAKTPVEDRAGILQLMSLGFGLADTNIQLTRPVCHGETDAVRPAIRFARPSDDRAVRLLAREAFIHDRFHRDPLIPDSVASRIKEEWAGNFFHGRRGDWLVVAEDADGLVGFLQLLRGPENVLTIDLIAVAAQARGRRMGRAMIQYAAVQCLGVPARMRVGTQLTNLPSLALYTGLDFRITDASHIWHRHLEEQKG